MTDGLERYREAVERAEKLNKNVQCTDNQIDEIVYDLHGLANINSVSDNAGALEEVSVEFPRLIYIPQRCPGSLSSLRIPIQAAIERVRLLVRYLRIYEAPELRTVQSKTVGMLPAVRRV